MDGWNEVKQISERDVDADFAEVLENLSEEKTHSCQHLPRDNLGPIYDHHFSIILYTSLTVTGLAGFGFKLDQIGTK